MATTGAARARAGVEAGPGLAGSERRRGDSLPLQKTRRRSLHSIPARPMALARPASSRGPRSTRGPSEPTGHRWTGPWSSPTLSPAKHAFGRTMIGLCARCFCCLAPSSVRPFLLVCVARPSVRRAGERGGGNEASLLCCCPWWKPLGSRARGGGVWDTRGKQKRSKSVSSALLLPHSLFSWPPTPAHRSQRKPAALA